MTGATGPPLIDGLRGTWGEIADRRPARQSP